MNFFKIGLALTFVLAVSSHAATEIVFKRNGKEVKRLDLDALPKELTKSEMKVFDTSALEEETYVGLKTEKLMNWAYGDEWKRNEEVLFTCSDGYQPSVPVDFLKRHGTMFATAIKGKKDFKIHNKLQNEKEVAVGPLYLVWNDLHDEVLKREGATWWPYQVISVDLVRFQDVFSKMAPAADASRAVKNGFLFHQKHCMSCHAINGQGGGKGPDLNEPDNAVDRLGEEKFTTWVLNPRSLKPDSNMPSLADDPALKARMPQIKAEIKDLIAYLRSMKKSPAKK